MPDEVGGAEVEWRALLEDRLHPLPSALDDRNDDNQLLMVASSD